MRKGKDNLRERIRVNSFEVNLVGGYVDSKEECKHESKSEKREGSSTGNETGGIRTGGDSRSEFMT